MDYRPSFHESVRPAELPVPVHSEQNPRSIAPSLRELTELGRSRVWSSQFGAWPPACAKAGGWSRLHCLGGRRIIKKKTHLLVLIGMCIKLRGSCVYVEDYHRRRLTVVHMISVR